MIDGYDILDGSAADGSTPPSTSFISVGDYIASSKHANGIVTLSRVTALEITPAAPMPSYEETWRHHGRRSPRPNRWRFVCFDGVGWRVSKAAKPRAKRRLARTGFTL